MSLGFREICQVAVAALVLVLVLLVGVVAKAFLSVLLSSWIRVAAD